MKTELTVVIPVYNEEACIGSVIESWRDVLKSINADYRILVLNDGSTDGTADLLQRFEEAIEVEVLNKSNSGHGPTILQGYRIGVTDSRWVFQVDSDDEVKSVHFPMLWRRREEYDALFGVRTGREQNASRLLITWVSRTVVRVLFGSGITDVNTPYRLMRSDILERIIGQIPDDTFAPNLIISGALVRGKARIFECSVPHVGRITGSASIVRWGLMKGAVKSFVQTLACRPRI